MFHMPGGFSDEQKANDVVQALCKQIKCDVSKQMHGANFATFTSINFIQQTVAGTNYIIKIFIGGDRCIHVKVFLPLPGPNAHPVVKGIQDCKTKKDKIAVF